MHLPRSRAEGRKRELRFSEPDAVLLLIDDVLCRIPVEVRLRHTGMLYKNHT